MYKPEEYKRPGHSDYVPGQSRSTGEEIKTTITSSATKGIQAESLVSDAGGTPLYPGDKVVYAARASNNGSPRKGIVLSATPGPQGRVELILALLYSTYYPRTNRLKYSLRTQKITVTSAYGNPPLCRRVLRVDYGLTKEETVALSSKRIQMPAGPLWGL
jgi:hypothetical protein